MKRLNLKALIILVLAGLLAGAGGYAFYKFQVRRNAQKLLAEAVQAERRNDRARAAQMLDRYLRYRPWDTAALSRLGMLQAELANSRQQGEAALAVLERALVRNPGNEPVRRRALQLALALERIPNARGHASELLAAHPENGEIEAALGRCDELEGKPREAASRYEKAIRLDPSYIEAYLRLAVLLRTELKDPARADEVMDELVRNNDASYLARLSRAAYRLDHGPREGVAGDIARALELAPDDPEVLLSAAQAAARESQWDQAREHLERGLARSPQDARMYQALAEVETRAGRLDEAEAILSRGVEALPKDADLKWRLAEIRLDQKALDQADEQIRELRDLSYKKERVDYLAAHALFVRQQWPEAAQALAAVAPRLGADSGLARRANLMLAECHAQLGDVSRQYDVYRRMVATDPGAADVRALLAASLESLGRDDEALEQYRLVTDPPPLVKLAIARLMIRENLQRPAAERRWDQVAAALDEAGREAPDEPLVALLRAEVLAYQDRAQNARALLEQARDAHPEQIELWSALILLAERVGKPDEARALLDAADKQLGDRVELRLFRARQLAERGGPDAAERLAELGHGLDSFPPEDQRRLLRGLAELGSRMGAHAAALSLWSGYAETRPRDLDAQLLAFDLAQGAGDVPAQDRALSRLRELEGPDGALWRFGQARQILAQARHDQNQGGTPNPTELTRARRLLTEAGRQRPSWPRVPVALAELEDLQGHTDAAIAEYLRAIEMGEQDLGVIRRALRMLAENGRHDEAHLVLARLSSRAGELRRTASELFLRNQDPAHALDLAEKAVAAGSSDFRDYLWLSQIRWAAGRRAEAEEPLRRAVALAGSNPAPTVALVQYLAASGQTPRAEQAVAEAEARFPPRDYPQALALCYEALGREDQARALYQGALKAAPDDPAILRPYATFLVRRDRSREAEPLLEKLAGAPGSAPQDAAWARNLLAVLLAGDADEQRTRKALELAGLGREPRAEPDQPTAALPLDQLRVQARVLAAQPDETRRREAVRLLEQILRRDPTAGDDRLLLAQLHELVGDWPKADATMRKLLESDRTNTRYRIEYVQALLRQKKADEAAPWLDQLDRLAPEAPRIAQLRAMVLAAQGKPAQAVELLRGYAERHADQLLPISLVLERIGQAQAAEDLLRQYVAANRSADPRSVLALAAFLGRQGRTSEALDVCEPAWSTLPPEEVGQCCTNILLARFDASQAGRVEEWLRAAVGRQPDAVALRVSLAILCSLQGQSAEAVRIYRQILEKEPDNPVVLNNLAWLLAYQGDRGAESLPLINRALERSKGPQVPGLLDTRAVVRLFMDEPDRAIRDLETAIANGPVAPMYFHLAQAHLRANRPDAARAALRDGERLGLKADSLEPVERPAYARLVATLSRP
jgi:tetratricopeptide (TPR) repeat protein